MIKCLQLFAVALLLLVLENGLAIVVPRYWLPDIGLIFIAGLGLRTRFVPGLWLTIAFGYVSDCLTGSFRGEHILVYLALFAITYIGNRQVNFIGFVRFAAVVCALTFLEGLGFIFFGYVFRAKGLLPISFHYGWWVRLIVNVACAPWILDAFMRVLRRGDADGSLRSSEGFLSKELNR